MDTIKKRDKKSYNNRRNKFKSYIAGFLALLIILGAVVPVIMNAKIYG